MQYYAIAISISIRLQRRGRKKFRDRTGGKCDRTEWVSNRKEDKSEANRAEIITIKHV